MAFTTLRKVRLPLWPPKRAARHNDAAGFASCCGPVSRSTPLRTRPLNRTRELPYQGPWCLPGPDSHRQAVLSLSLSYVTTTSFAVMAPELLGAPQ